MQIVKKERERNLLGPQQVEEAKRKIAGLEQFLKTHKNSEFKRVREADETFARHELVRYKRMLEQRQAPVVTGDDRDKMYRRVKYLEKLIKVGMPTKDQMMGKRHSHYDNPNSKYQEAVGSDVDQFLKWNAQNEGRVREWKRLKRTLEPENPGATNIEMLRSLH